MRESRDSLVNTQIQSHALLRRGFGTSVPFMVVVVLSLTSEEHLIEAKMTVLVLVGADLGPC